MTSHNRNRVLWVHRHRNLSLFCKTLLYSPGHKGTFFYKNHMLQQKISLLCGGECKSDLEMSQCALPETKSACSDVVKTKVLRNRRDDNCTASTSSSTKSEFICLSNPSTCWNALRSAFSSWLKIRWNVGHFSALWKHPLKQPSNPHWI